MRVDLDKLSTQYCSEPYEYNAKKVVHMIPDIVTEFRALREIAEAAMRFHMGHVHFCARVTSQGSAKCNCNIDDLFEATRDYETKFIEESNDKEESYQVQSQSQA